VTGPWPVHPAMWGVRRTCGRRIWEESPVWVRVSSGGCSSGVLLGFISFCPTYRLVPNHFAGEVFADNNLNPEPTFPANLVSVAALLNK